MRTKDYLEFLRSQFKSVVPVLVLVLVLFLLTGWGSTGHKIINRGGAVELPVEMLGFIQRASMLADSASNADNRKGKDPTESPKHFIDIDDYPEFATKTVSHSLDSLIQKYGLQRVTTNGFLPWAIADAADSLTAQMQRGNWNKAWSTAADVGHYVGDAHQPLHCTANYDGQLTGNRGIHSRYESSMVDRYQQSIIITAGQVTYVESALGFVFDVIYRSQSYCDSILKADDYAKQVSGWNGSGQEPAQYYTALWAKAGGFTNVVMQRAVDAFASLLYSAWVRAGRPSIPTTSGVSDQPPAIAASFELRQNYPNPFNPTTNVEFRIAHFRLVTLRVFDLLGKEVATLVNDVRPAGVYTLRWDASSLPSGVYYYQLRAVDASTSSAGVFVETKKMILAK
jgi:hypothetical protein